MTPGVIEIILVLLVFVIVGPRRIADLFRSMGRGVHDFVDNLGGDGERKELGDGQDARRESDDRKP